MILSTRSAPTVLSKKTRPGCTVRNGHLNPHDRAAGLARRLCQAVDVRHDLPRRRHLHRSPLGQERILHVDDDQRRALRIEPVDDIEPPAPLHHPVDDVLRELEGMHGNIPA
jgi:hypothetical protein